jgi:hypothetical protein
MNSLYSTDEAGFEDWQNEIDLLHLLIDLLLWTPMKAFKTFCGINSVARFAS